MTDDRVKEVLYTYFLAESVIVPQNSLYCYNDQYSEVLKTILVSNPQIGAYLKVCLGVE